ncbi:MAG: hypothetical protein AAB567_03520 [Patescibacteria group bacterium]
MDELDGKKEYLEEGEGRFRFHRRVFVIFGAVILVLILVAVLLWRFFLVTPEEPFGEKKPIGILVTTEGFVKVNPQGFIEKDGSGNRVFFVTPGIEDWAKLHPNTKSALKLSLLDDGRLLFIGAPEASPMFTKNTIYAWDMDHLDHPKPFFEKGETHTIESFAISPDKNQIAIISHKGSDIENLEVGSEEWQRRVKEQEEFLQEELRTISLHDLQSGKLLRLMKIAPLEPPLRRATAGTIVWTERGLFVYSYKPYLTLFDPETSEIINDFELEGEHMHIFPDGLKYYRTDGVIGTFPDGTIIAKFAAAEYVSSEEIRSKNIDLQDIPEKIISVGRHPSSYDSISDDGERMILSGLNAFRDKFVIWEFIPETGGLVKIADETFLPFDWASPEQLKSVDPKFSIPEFFYSPNEERIFFILESFEEPAGLGTPKRPDSRIPQADLFVIERGAKKAVHLAQLPSRTRPPYFRSAFLGWYQPTNK